MYPAFTFGEGQIMAEKRYSEAEAWAREHSPALLVGHDEIKSYIAKHRPGMLPALNGLPYE